MCGFVGRVTFRNNNINNDVMRESLELIKHRGPDEQKVKKGDFWEFGFCRLSILDLTKDGSQPMMSHDNNSVLLFNGEIYNYIEIKKELHLNNILLKSSGDTEVLLRWLDFKGVSGLNKINGMFSFVYLNISKRQLVLARDRVGKKPLLYHIDEDSIIFSSEMKSLSNLSKGNFEIDHIAMNQYFCFGYIPAPRTMYKKVKKLEPGNFLNINKNNFIYEKPKKYWNLSYKPQYNYSFNDWIDSTEHLLRNSVKIRLNSDVGIGTFLSGGIDSNLITYFANEYLDYDIQSFTIGFKNRHYDESRLAENSALQMKISNENFILDFYKSDIDIKNLVYFFDEPFCDLSLIPSYMLCKKASNYGKVFLSGDGGDEVFCGYKRYFHYQNYNWLDYIPNFLKRTASRFDGFYNKLGRLSLNNDERKVLHHHPYFGDKNNYRIINDKYKIDSSLVRLDDKEFYNSKESYPILSKMQLYDIENYLSNDILTKVDRASMANSIEVRSPLLDYRLMEHSLSIPSNFYIKNRSGKQILKSIAKRYLNNDVLNFKKKGFSIPEKDWLLINKKEIMRNYFEPAKLHSKEYYDLNQIKEVSNQFFKYNNTSLSNLVWKFIIFEEWSRQSIR
tara:strand:- start:4305 stop:6155 length:1851 start_codon:yes stop_codon:yes gene_type:complete